MSYRQHLSVLITPKIFRDFQKPLADAQRFFSYYGDLFRCFRELRIILAVGNSVQILQYSGRDGWDSNFAWGRYSNYTVDGTVLCS